MWFEGLIGKFEVPNASQIADLNEEIGRWFGAPNDEPRLDNPKHTEAISKYGVEPALGKFGPNLPDEILRRASEMGEITAWSFKGHRTDGPWGEEGAGDFVVDEVFPVLAFSPGGSTAKDMLELKRFLEERQHR
jgi:hypothetical protein